MPRPQATPQLEFTIRCLEDAQNRVATAEAELSAAKAYLKYVGEHEMVESSLTLPESTETGVALSDGTEYVLEQKYHCSVDPQQRQEAYEHIEAATKGQSLKRTLTLSFGKGTLERQQLVKKMIAELLPQYEISIKVGKAPDKLVADVTSLLESVGLDESVALEEGLELAGATMRAWVVKQIRLGNTVPPFFQVYAPVQAMLVPPSAPQESLEDKLRRSIEQGAHGAMVTHGE